MRSHLRTLLVLALAGVLLALFLRHVDLRRVAADIGRANTTWLLVALATMLVNLMLRAWRWQYLLAPLGGASFRSAFRMTVIGFAASALLPARAGEVIRPYLLARREGLSATGTFATIILERLLDTLTVLALFGSFLVLFDPGMNSANAHVFGALKFGGLLAALFSVVAVAVLFLVAADPRRLGRLARSTGRLLPASLRHRGEAMAQTFGEGLGAILQPRRLAAALALSFPLWLSIAAGIWAVAVAFGISVPFTGTFLLVALLVVGVAVPTPGAVGGFHEAFRIGATLFYGASNEVAVGAAIVLHAMTQVPVILLGVLFTAQDGLRWSGLRVLASRAHAASVPSPPEHRGMGKGEEVA